MRNKILKFFLYIFKYIDLFNDRTFIKKINEFPKLDGISLVDIGSSYDIQPRWKKIKKILNYHGFEPNKDLHDKLKNKNKDCLSYNVYPYLISDKKEETTLNICHNPGVSSIFKPNFKFLSKFKNSARFKVIKELNIEANYLDNLNLRKVDFIKIDIQGAELKALNGSVNTIKETIGIEIEVEFQKMYEEQPIFGDINNFIKNQKFEFIDFLLIKRWERNNENSFGQAIFADALYLRTPEFANENFDSNKMSKFILILLLYNKFDLINDCKLEKFFSKEEIIKINKIVNFFKNKNKIVRFITSVSTGLSKLFGNEYKSHSFH